MGAKIEAIEYVLPSRVVSNEELANRFPNYDFSKFEDKVGIKYRCWAQENETALDLAIRACEKLFDRVDKQKIDYVIYCTQSPEFYLPTTACILQDRLGLRTDIGAFDYNLGCSGFVYGISMAKALIASDQCTNVLLVTAETYSKYIHPNDKSNLAIFGDAAAATLITKSEKNAVGNFLFGTDGSGWDKLIVKNGAGKNDKQIDAPLCVYGSDNEYTDNHLYMNGPEIFNFTSARIPNFTEQVLHKNGKGKEEVDFFVLHQANEFMLNFLRKKMQVDKDRFYIDMKYGGNTVSNTIPIALKRLSESLDTVVSKKIVIVGFGVGLSWAGGLIDLDNKL